MAKKVTREDCWTALVRTIDRILDEMGEEVEALTREMMINADLGLSSVEAIHMAIMLENELRLPLNFEALAVRDGEYATDLSIGEIYDFVLATAGLVETADEETTR